MAVMDKIRDVEMPDVSKLELPKIDTSKIDMPKVDVGKARDRVSGATSNWRDAMTNRLPQREAPSRIPYLVGGLLAGLSIGYFVATSDWFQPMVKDTVDQWRQRIDQMRAQSSGNGSDLNEATYTELTAVMDETVTTDPLAGTGTAGDTTSTNRPNSEESYAI